MSASSRPKPAAHAAPEIALTVDHYRRGYHAALALALILTGVTVGSLILAYIGWSRPVVTRYFATSNNGRIVTLRPLTAPLLSRLAITSFATDAATRLYTLDFARWRADIARARTDFLPQPFALWRQSIQQSLLPSIIQERLIASAAPAAAPTILGQGVLGQAGALSGRYGWSVRVRLIVSYLGVQGTTSQHVTVTMLIVRVNPDTYPRGVAIAHLTITQSKGEG